MSERAVLGMTELPLRRRSWMQAHPAPSRRYENVQNVCFLILFVLVLFAATVVLP